MYALSLCLGNDRDDFLPRSLMKIFTDLEDNNLIITPESYEDQILLDLLESNGELYFVKGIRLSPAPSVEKLIVKIKESDTVSLSRYWCL